MSKHVQTLQQQAISLLQELVATPSFSREEDQTAGIISRYLAEQDIYTSRIGNNVFAFNKYFDPSKKTILLNSHHDTVKPNPAYTRDPFQPVIEDGKLFGLGSNDAGGCLVSLIAAFIYFYEQQPAHYNLALAATAEEEISGKGGIEMVLNSPHFTEQLKGSSITGAIVGEPTNMQLAVAERGLMVLDCTTHGKAGHAARNEGINALYLALDDINWFRNYQFSKTSELLGPVQMTVTVINTENKAHNVIPATCSFVTDVRVHEKYSFEEILKEIKEGVKCDIQPRSLRMRSTAIATDHPLVQAGMQMGKKCYGSPTTSDKALMSFPALKMGPGDSARSHTADEFIYLNEVEQGIEDYINLLKKVL